MKGTGRTLCMSKMPFYQWWKKNIFSRIYEMASPQQHDPPFDLGDQLPPPPTNSAS